MGRRGPVAVPGVDNSGAGSPGYCKLCAFKDGAIQNQFDDRTRARWTPAQLNRWASTKITDWVDASDPTFYKHRKHVEHPQDRIVNAVQRTQQRALATKPISSPEAFLDSLVSIGHQRAIDNPGEVTIDHALRAASTKMQAKGGARDGLNVLIALITGNAAPRTEVYEGEAVEVS